MTKRDFVAVASAIKATRNAPSADDACEFIAREFAAHAASINPRFDRARFLAATREDKS